MNLPILVIAFGAFVATNQHFGWNGMPKSDLELIADLVAFLILALAFVR